jgi:hypothetical protein
VRRQYPFDRDLWLGWLAETCLSCLFVRLAEYKRMAASAGRCYLRFALCWTRYEAEQTPKADCCALCNVTDLLDIGLELFAFGPLQSRKARELRAMHQHSLACNTWPSVYC